MKRDKTEFKILPAYHGDSILIKTFNDLEEELAILIDGGTASTFQFTLKKELEQLSKIDILILTHIDSDHIGGIVKFLKSDIAQKIAINEIWVNHPELIEVNKGEQISYKQAYDFKKLIEEKYPATKIKNITTEKSDFSFEGVNFKILSPTKEIVAALYEKWQKEDKTQKNDIRVNISVEKPTYSISLRELSKLPFSPDNSVYNDLFNASSIAFLMKCPDISLLLLGDSRSEIIEKELKETWFYNAENRLDCDFVKVSHHGSKNNTSEALVELLKCSNFIISTNGGTSKNIHPSRETIARIIFRSNRNYEETVKIYMNYSIDSLKTKIGNFINEGDFSDGNWEMVHKNSFNK